MPRGTTPDDDDDGAPPPGGGPPGAEEAAGEQAANFPPSAGVASAPAAANATSSPSAAAAAGVENHPAPDDAPVPVAQTAAALEMEELRNKKGVEEIDSSADDAPVPVGMMDTSYDRAEKGFVGPKSAMKSGVELADRDDEGPVPPGSIPGDGGDSAKIEAKKASSAAASRNVRARTAAIIESKSAESSAAQPRVATGPSGMRDGGEDAQPTLVTPTVRPPPPSMLPRDSSASDPVEPSVPILHATLVEDEPEQPVYDAVPVGEEHWAKRHQRKIVGGFVLVIAAMAVALGVAFGTGGGDDGIFFATSQPSSSVSPSSPPTLSLSPSVQPSMYPRPCFVDSNELKAAVDEYSAGGFPCFAGDTECEVIQTYGWPIGTWCTSNVTDMSRLFEGNDNFDEDLSSWDTSKVTSMERMFNEAKAFNQDLPWDTSKVTSMRSMFYGATAFNRDVSNFDTSKVTSMYGMFAFASSFNRYVSNFDTSKVTSMASMFDGASAFNQDVSRWDMASVTNMRWMFKGASSFNQNLCAWGVHYNATVRDYGADDDWSANTGPYYNMFLESNCPNQNDPSGPDTNWCAATCNSAVSSSPP